MIEIEVLEHARFGYSGRLSAELVNDIRNLIETLYRVVEPSLKLHCACERCDSRNFLQFPCILKK